MTSSVFGGQKEIYAPHQLEQLKKEINLRVKITKNEIFKIGELLNYAKNLCQQEGIKFQEWISKNFDFSYETANNFMNVYKNCFGFRSIAMNISPSILYKIAAPSFPDELRNYLFDTDNLNKITNGKLKEIVQKYKEGGFEAIQDDIEEFNRGLLIEKHTMYTFDEVENALRTLDSLVKKIEMRGISRGKCFRFEDQIEDDEPEAIEINSKLINALREAIKILEKAQKESIEILSNVEKGLLERCSVDKSLGMLERKCRVESKIQLGKMGKNSLKMHPKNMKM